MGQVVRDADRTEGGGSLFVVMAARSTVSEVLSGARSTSWGRLPGQKT